jgi:hypothetical protein
MFKAESCSSTAPRWQASLSLSRGNCALKSAIAHARLSTAPKLLPCKLPKCALCLPTLCFRRCSVFPTVRASLWTPTPLNRSQSSCLFPCSVQPSAVLCTILVPCQSLGCLRCCLQSRVLRLPLRVLLFVCSVRLSYHLHAHCTVCCAMIFCGRGSNVSQTIRFSSLECS